MTRHPLLIGIAVVALLAGCTAPGPGPNGLAPGDAEGVQPAGDAEVIASDLTTPWSLVRMSDGSTLISERDTALVRQLQPDGEYGDDLVIDDVVPGGEGGLLGIAVDPEEQFLYYYATAADDNRVLRAELSNDDGWSIGEPEVILEGMAKAGNHNGGRIAFGPDGMLYITAGDAGDPDRAQSLDSLGGKILRVEPDGAIPTDNPFEGSPVYSLGHRNPQGIAWDDEGQLFAAEFGQNTWDEFNRIDAGSNYGWPIVEGIGEVEGFVDPLYQWPTSQASPSGLLYTQGTFFLAALRGERVWVLYLDGDRVSAVSWFEGEHGRIRHAAEGPDGSLWLLTSNTDGNGDQREGADQLLQYRLNELVEG
ncbi:PQQ-dependent sugar dehydrogenase [Glaciihabitans arcticus]|uniref:PQQ-dependent sugar dehydrogenase n=1 Tax=Glaciihabitans arcticus TaxID=2668039 RepID=A0A4Q9GS81_9MICO|nr:PQQ-dependent sugar dehydrogenase [Glaciihabitans arcticus]TBN57866.1 PQQ-dependent sugar dehydrogenase [Glaciihabitans arcticus]